VIWKNNSIPNVARAGAGDSVVTISNIKDEFGNGLLDPGGNYTVLVTPSQPCMVGVSANRDVDTSKRHAGGGLDLRASEKLAALYVDAILNSPFSRKPEWTPEGKTMWRVPRRDA
jgi:hypothetical protein